VRIRKRDSASGVARGGRFRTTGENCGIPCSKPIWLLPKNGGNQQRCFALQEETPWRPFVSTKPSPEAGTKRPQRFGRPRESNRGKGGQKSFQKESTRPLASLIAPLLTWPRGPALSTGDIRQTKGGRGDRSPRMRRFRESLIKNAGLDLSGRHEPFRSYEGQQKNRRKDFSSDGNRFWPLWAETPTG